MRLLERFLCLTLWGLLGAILAQQAIARLPEVILVSTIQDSHAICGQGTLPILGVNRGYAGCTSWAGSRIRLVTIRDPQVIAHELCHAYIPGHDSDHAICGTDRSFDITYIPFWAYVYVLALAYWR